MIEFVLAVIGAVALVYLAYKGYEYLREEKSPSE